MHHVYIHPQARPILASLAELWVGSALANQQFAWSLMICMSPTLKMFGCFPVNHNSSPKKCKKMMFYDGSMMFYAIKWILT